MIIPTLRCDKNLFEKDLNGKNYIVTGANSGVGLETTRQLVKQGAHVVMACRRVDSAKEVAKSFTSFKGTVSFEQLDLSDLESVKLFTKRVRSKLNKIDGLVNNAGMVTSGQIPKRTKQGFEMMFGVNHLGHFLLTESLLDIINNTEGSRIVMLSSIGHAGSNKKRPNIHFEDLNYENRNFNRTDAYCESKLASLLYAKELAERVKDQDSTVVSVHPGWAKSNLAGKGFTAFVQNVLLTPVAPLLTIMSNEDAAQTSLHCLLDDDVPNHSGEYFSQNSLLYSDKACRRGGWPMKSPNPNAHNMKIALKLTEVSKEMVGLK
ncbi:SDR family oxidoreductase [Acidaminobacter sp. JC074]|uniref:SDR family oxidoreductase n=1 Tax=Acidaminobacter sp. JC074 TaxID=2530199 RepID=UPI001F10CD08|nr:SDR family oxidoreductase [Acidaminobacter sp. JC074]MCH4887664.1 SDR family oxidoreductase [Acidaminobacter sp. JC074]